MLENKKLTEEVLNNITGGEVMSEPRDDIPEDPYCRFRCKCYDVDLEAGYDLNDSICSAHCKNYHTSRCPLR